MQTAAAASAAVSKSQPLTRDQVNQAIDGVIASLHEAMVESDRSPGDAFISFEQNVIAMESDVSAWRDARIALMGTRAPDTIGMRKILEANRDEARRGFTTEGSRFPILRAVILHLQGKKRREEARREADYHAEKLIMLDRLESPAMRRFVVGT